MKKTISCLFLALFFLTGCASAALSLNNVPIQEETQPKRIQKEESAPAKPMAVEAQFAPLFQSTSSEIKRTEPVEIQEIKENLLNNSDKKEEVTPVAAPNGTYTNVDGNEVPSPYVAPSRPAGASAICRDGSYSFSQHRSGTCSHHGGVAEWY